MTTNGVKKVSRMIIKEKKIRLKFFLTHPNRYLTFQSFAHFDSYMCISRFIHCRKKYLTTIYPVVDAGVRLPNLLLTMDTQM